MHDCARGCVRVWCVRECGGSLMYLCCYKPYVDIYNYQTYNPKQLGTNTNEGRSVTIANNCAPLLHKNNIHISGYMKYNVKSILSNCCKLLKHLMRTDTLLCTLLFGSVAMSLSYTTANRKVTINIYTICNTLTS